MCVVYALHTFTTAGCTRGIAGSLTVTFVAITLALGVVSPTVCTVDTITGLDLTATVCVVRPGACCTCVDPGGEVVSANVVVVLADVIATRT